MARAERGGQIYRKKKREYKELCERKKQEENKKWEREAEKAKMEGKMWEVINRERKRRRKINRDSKMEEWEEYFKALLGGWGKKMVWGEQGERRRGEDIFGGDQRGNKKFERREGIMGMDGIPNDVWRYGGEEIK